MVCVIKGTVSIKGTGFLCLYKNQGIYQRYERRKREFYLETVVSPPRSEMQSHQRGNHPSPLWSLCKALCSLHGHTTVRSFPRGAWRKTKAATCAASLQAGGSWCRWWLGCQTDWQLLVLWCLCSEGPGWGCRWFGLGGNAGRGGLAWWWHWGKLRSGELGTPSPQWHCAQNLSPAAENPQALSHLKNKTHRNRSKPPHLENNQVIFKCKQNTPLLQWMCKPHVKGANNSKVSTTLSKCNHRTEKSLPGAFFGWALMI